MRYSPWLASPGRRCQHALCSASAWVLRSGDPRAKIVKQSADEVLKKLGVTDPLLDIAKALEERALADDYFVERKLYPNVDFYTGVIYKAMGFPTRMFTVLFALGRLPGWIAQWAVARAQALDVVSVETDGKRWERDRPDRTWSAATGAASAGVVVVRTANA